MSSKSNIVAKFAAFGIAAFLLSGSVAYRNYGKNRVVGGRGFKIPSMKSISDVDSKRFELLNVAILFRHGARTPNYYIYTPKYNLPNWRDELNLIPELCYNADLKELPSKKIISEDNLYEIHNCTPDECIVGQLTRLGQNQSVALGKEIKARYGHGFLNKDFNSNEIYSYTTKYPRTYYTLKGVIAGIYGLNAFDKCHRPIIYTSSHNDEVYIPNSKVCSVIEKFIPYGYEDIKKDSEIINMKCHLAELLGVEKLVYLNESDLKVNKKTFDENCKPKLDVPTIMKVGKESTVYGIRDDFVSRTTNSFEFPKEIFKLQSEMDRLAIREILSEYMGGSKEWEDRILLLVSPTINFIQKSFDQAISDYKNKMKKESCVQDMQATLQKIVPRKMELLSAHDTTIIPLLMTFRVFDSEWPPFLSHVIFELYREKETDKFFTRMIYNGKVQRLIIDEDDCSVNARNDLNGLVSYERMLKHFNHYSVPANKYIETCDKAMKLFTSGKSITRDQII